MSKKLLFAALLSALTFCAVACQSTSKTAQPGPELYQKYDMRVDELRRQVQSGLLSVTEAEQLRQQAYQEYLDELQAVEVARQQAGNKVG